MEYGIYGGTDARAGSEHAPLPLGPVSLTRLKVNGKTDKGKIAGRCYASS